LFKLKKVELLGFKSFADRTRLEFTDGVAAVVGPNGCGKSNLSDAISWVLGEQSARMLRGERMADVIFNGTGTRPPTGMAEVNLTLIDPEYDESDSASDDGPAAQDASTTELFEESQAPAAISEDATEKSNGNGAMGKGQPKDTLALLRRTGEITVTRRLFRSGESEYLINNELCRLRDIQDLFMGTGLGPESYAIIEQGRIGQILSTKPADRRAIIEEAAGVSKFKTRKRLAEAKLESARGNLARIADILEEVTKQVNSLKRQASKARRYRELHDELRGRLKGVLTSRLIAFDSERTRLSGELGTLQQECATLAGRLEELEREYKTVTARHEELELQLTQAREIITQNDLERQRLESRIEQITQQVDGLEARVVESAAESEQLQAQTVSLDRELAQIQARALEIKTASVAAQEDALRLGARRDEVSARLTEGENQAESLRQSVLAAVSSAAEARNQLVQAEEIGLALDRQACRTEAELSGAGQEYDQLKNELALFSSEQLRGVSDVEGLGRRLAESLDAQTSAKQEQASCRASIESLRQEFSAAQARKQTLEESLARHAYSTESVRKLLSPEHPRNGHQFRPLGLLADFVEVSQGYEDVVEEFLKNDLDCVVVEGHEEARSGIALLQSEGSGRSTFFVTRVASNGHSNGGNPNIRATAGVVARVRDLVKFAPRLGLNGDFTLPALENAYVVEDSATAEQLVGKFPDSHFLTTDGKHYHHRLVAGGKGSSSGPLALRRDFRELERRTLELEAAVGSTETMLAQSTARVIELESEIDRLSREKQEAEKRSVVSDEKLRQTREAFSRAEQRVAVLKSELANVSSERHAVDERQAALREKLSHAAAAQVQFEQEISRVNQKVRELRSQADSVALELAQAQSHARALEERTLAVESEQARLVAQREEVQMRLRRLAELLAAWREEQHRLRGEREAAHTRLSELEARQQSLRAELSLAEEEAAATRARRDQLTPAIDEARSVFEARREARTAVEVALARAESDLEHHSQLCRDELSTEPAQLIAELPPENILTDEPLQLAEEEVRALKTRIENLGPVNMMALEELQEAEERFQFLEAQRQDLLVSIEDTAQAIREIDQVCRQQFLQAFKAINEYFAESFRTLFGGGIGQMRLSDDTDPESGLDIVAQPPGKRLQNVLLLSGGEKALAALALLIAVFRYAPSPFCILDEVDAPLDESNVDRFTRMIREMSRHTQFILITHNKRTMEIAKLLYGVTMEEPGVSRMVSVRFDEVVEEPVAVPA
jgi:chromosome segregation protein